MKLPLMPVDVTNCKVPVGIALADPNFNIPSAIDMLLGAEIFFDLLSNNQIRPIPQRPIFRNTRFGWIISGPVPHSSKNNGDSSTNLFTCVNNEVES